MQPRSGAYVIGLDHLRAFAALLVIFWHSFHYVIPYGAVPDYWIVSLFEEGWIGVSLFISITGFVFTVNTHNKDIDYFGFLKNRLLRLLPLIFLVMLYAVSIVPIDPDKPRETNQLFLFFNLLGGGQVYGTWSLVVEFQFYISYPFLRDRLTRNSTGATLLNCGLFCLLLSFFRLACFYQNGSVQYISYFTIFGQGDAFITGIIAGLAFVRWRTKPPKKATLVYLIIVGLSFSTTVAAVHWLNTLGGFYNNQGYPSTSAFWVFWPTIIAVCWASLLAPYCLLTINTSGAISKAVGYLGTVSYSTYMLHFITVPLCKKLFDIYLDFQIFSSQMWNDATKIMLIYYPVTIAVSAISYELIEKAFLKRRVPYLSARNEPRFHSAKANSP